MPNTALLIPATKHDSYQLEIFTLVWWGLRLLFRWSNSQRRYLIAVCQWKFSENQKKSTDKIFPEYPGIYLISKSIRPNKYPFNSHVGPRRNIWHKNQGNISSFLVPVEWSRNKYRSVCHSLTILFGKPEKIPLVNVVILRWNPCGLPITKFASTSCLSQTYIS